MTIDKTLKHQYLMNYTGKEHEMLCSIIQKSIEEDKKDYIIKKIEKFHLSSLPEYNIYLIETKEMVENKMLKEIIIQYAHTHNENMIKEDNFPIKELYDMDKLIEIEKVGNVNFI